MNKILISEDRLQLILEKHKSDIGSKDNWSNVVTGVSFIVSTCSASYGAFLDIPGNLIKSLILIIAVCLTGWGVLMVMNSHKDKFDHNKLYEEMRKANEIEHPFSIVAIKDTFSEYPNKYLLYYDNRWNCWFFMNFRTNQEESQNEKNIKNGLSAKLKISPDDFDLEYRTEAIHPKYSESDKEKKYYHHRLYKCIVKEFSDDLKKSKFTIDNVDYTWMSIDEMEKNPSIRKHNMDVVEFVKHNNL